MIKKEKIIEILHSHSYNVEDQAGNHLIVVDDDSWDEIAEQVKNCSIPNVVGQSEQPCTKAGFMLSLPDDEDIQKKAKKWLKVNYGKYKPSEWRAFIEAATWMRELSKVNGA